MRAFRLDGFDTPPTLHEHVPEPGPAGGEVLIRVHASSVNPVDAAIAAGMLKGMAEYGFPVTLGRDFAGVVERAGDGVTRFGTGDEVYGFVLHASPAVHDGSWADLIAVPEDNFVPAKPPGVDMETAGAAPVTGLTALAAFDALAPTAGDTVLVLGATGGVGSLFVQLAEKTGAQIVAPGLPEDEDYLRGLGAGELLDRAGDLETVVRERHPGGVDAILDLVSFAPEASLLADGGRLASALGAAGEGPGRFNLMAQPTPANLQRLAGLLEDGTLRVEIQETFTLAQAGEALAALGGTHTRGKLAISIT